MECVTRIRQSLDGTISGCVLSTCERYRYALWRIWDASAPLWMMALLNPSTATEEVDDQTVKRCVRRVQRGGGGGLVVVNTGAIRETNADLACRADDPIGPFNSTWVRSLIPTCSFHLAGWGPNASRFGGDRELMQLFDEAGIALHVLKVNRDGSPRHPLYVSYATQPVLF